MGLASILASALAWGLLACDTAHEAPVATAAPEPGGVLRVGVQAWDMPSRVEESFEPIEQALAGALMHHGAGRSVEIVPFAIYGELLAAVTQGYVDVARMESASYLTARQREPGITLLALERSARGTPRQGMIITSAYASIDTLDDLRGKTFAFGDEYAAIGRYLPRAALLAAGLRAPDLGAMSFLRRGDKIAAAVRLGEFDAGVVSAETFRRVNVDGSLRVLAPLADAPRPWVARAGLERQLVGTLTAVLLDLHDAPCLRALDAAGFAPAAQDTYEPVRAAMAAAAEFDAGNDTAAPATAQRSRP
ncbi:MAG TPA: PhnD/SsuA/transferrin family substrate-binding protein [Haliangium sp.]|nr:PhnD/SsuA/transferrin family substrate-binding protein [Haliangium sp.]